MTTFKIDISHNERQGFKALGTIAYLFIVFFAGTGVFILYKTYQKNGEWANYLTAIWPLIMALIIYLQLTGKGPYKKYFQVDTEKVQYRVIPFSTIVIPWAEVHSVECEHSKIRFF
jgi:hypothetical protein